MGAAPRPRVVVVDDAPFMRRQLREILEDAGCAVVAEGGDGREGLRLCAEHAPDLVTLDLVMPNMDGLEALGELRLRHPEVPVIVCSSLSHEAAIFRAIDLGARDYVVKPVRAEKLLDAVAKALAGRG